MSRGQHDLFIDAPIWEEGLTGRRRRFVECYCLHPDCFANATAAYIKAYSRPGKELADSSIQSNAARLMRDPKIKEAIAKLLRARQNKEDQLTEFQILDMLKRLALYDPKDLYDENNQLKKMKDLGPLSVCVTEVKTTRFGGREVKLFDRGKAIAMLGQYLGIERPSESDMTENPIVYLPEKDMARIREKENAPPPASEDAEYEVVA